jgi:hypothetical protein
VENGELRFDGQIKWRKGGNTLQWSLRNMDVTKKAVFGNGDTTTNDDCREELALFTRTERRLGQFEIVKPVIYRLWQALIDEFGYPTLE